MPFIYKPIRQYMQPNESTINPQTTTKFSLIIGGQTCIAYRFLVYDLQNNLISAASTNRTVTTMRYNITGINILQDMFIIASNDLYNGEEIEFFTDGTLPRPLQTGKSYYVGNVEFGRFNIFLTKQEALNGTNKIDIIDGGDGNHNISVKTPLYDGDTLEIYLSANKLSAGNTYKWQVELFANDLNVTSVDVTNNTLTIPNHNLVTGDMIYVSATTLPAPLTSYTVYYVRKIDSNTIALFLNIEGARNDAGRIDITSAGAGVVISNIAISEQIVFMAYDDPIVIFEPEIINQQSYRFKPIYNHPQGVMISNFTAYIRSEQNPELITSSGLQENIRLEYTFDGLLNGSVYDVKFVINTKANQEYSTPWVPFAVDYASPNLGLTPDIENNEASASIIMRWSGIKQIIGDPVGDMEFIDNFVVQGNTGLLITSDAYLVFSGLNIQAGSSPPMFWWNPVQDNFEGRIMRCDNTITGEYIEIGYNGTNFYRTINGITIDNAPVRIYPQFVYMIGLTLDQLIVNVIGNVNI